MRKLVIIIVIKTLLLYSVTENTYPSNVIKTSDVVQ